MRFSTALIVLAGAVASSSAATLFPRQYPSCANPCIANADIGTCDPSDLGCLCKDQNFIASTTACIVASCNAADTVTAENVAKQFCETVGITLSGTPTVSPSATPSGSGSASPSASASGSTAPSGSGASSSKPSSTAPPSSGSASVSASKTPAPSATGNSATSHGANALLGLAAVGFAAFAL